LFLGDFLGGDELTRGLDFVGDDATDEMGVGGLERRHQVVQLLLWGIIREIYIRGGLDIWFKGHSNSMKTTTQ